MLAFTQLFLGLPGLGDVLDGAGHFHRTPLSVEIEPSNPVHPAHRAIRRANNPILPVKRLTLAEYLILEISEHRRSIVGMDEGRASFNGALVGSVNSEDLVHDVGTCPSAGVDIEQIAAETGNSLRLFEQIIALAKRRVGAFSIGNVLGEDDDPSELAVAAKPRSNLSS